MQKQIDVLLVEDSPGDAKLFMLLLTEMNFPGKVKWVVDGVEAMDYLYQKSKYSNSARPDAIILDLNLPRKDGREVLKEIKANPELKAIPVFIVTTSEGDGDLIKRYQFESTYFYTKSKDLGGFESMVKTLLTVHFALL